MVHVEKGVNDSAWYDMTAACLWRTESGYGKGDWVSFRFNRTTHKVGCSMNFNGQLDSDINPMLLDISKNNLGRHGRRRFLYLKEQRLYLSSTDFTRFLHLVL